MSIIRFTSLRTKLNNLSANLSEKIKLPEKYKGTIVDRWAIYWKSLMSDYADVGRGVFKTAKEKPLRASVIGTVGYALYACAKNNPDEDSLITEIRKWSCEMAMVHESCQRSESAEALKMLERSMNQGTLRILNLGVVSLLWLHDFNKDLCTYRAIAKHLQPEYLTFHERVIDVGFWNKWWNLERKMVDYDISEDL